MAKDKDKDYSGWGGPGEGVGGGPGGPGGPGSKGLGSGDSKSKDYGGPGEGVGGGPGGPGGGGQLGSGGSKSKSDSKSSGSSGTGREGTGGGPGGPGGGGQLGSGSQPSGASSVTSTPSVTGTRALSGFSTALGNAARTALGAVTTPTGFVPDIGGTARLGTAAATAARISGARTEREVLAMGTNDFQNPTTAVRALEAAVANARALGRSPVAVMPNPTGKTAAVNQALTAAAARLGIGTITPASWAKDGIHPTTDAYDRIAKNYDGAIVSGDSFAEGIIGAQPTKNALSFGVRGASAKAIADRISRRDAATAATAPPTPSPTRPTGYVPGIVGQSPRTAPPSPVQRTIDRYLTPFAGRKEIPGALPAARPSTGANIDPNLLGGRPQMSLSAPVGTGPTAMPMMGDYAAFNPVAAVPSGAFPARAAPSSLRPDTRPDQLMGLGTAIRPDTRPDQLPPDWRVNAVRPEVPGALPAAAAQAGYVPSIVGPDPTAAPDSPMNYGVEGAADEEAAIEEGLPAFQNTSDLMGFEQAMRGTDPAAGYAQAAASFQEGGVIGVGGGMSPSLLSATIDRMIGVESANNPKAKNRLSTATGLGQFLKSTWVGMIDRHRPDLAHLTRDEKLALRTDPVLSRAMTTAYAQENAAKLAQAGISITPETIYAAHFLGPYGAIAAYRANPSTPAVDVLGARVVNANPGIMKGRTIGRVLDYVDRKMAGVSGAPAPQTQTAATTTKTRSQTDAASPREAGLIARDNALQAVRDQGGDPDSATAQAAAKAAQQAAENSWNANVYGNAPEGPQPDRKYPERPTNTASTTSTTTPATTSTAPKSLSTASIYGNAPTGITSGPKPMEPLTQTQQIASPLIKGLIAAIGGPAGLVVGGIDLLAELATGRGLIDRALSYTDENQFQPGGPLSPGGGDGTTGGHERLTDPAQRILDKYLKPVIKKPVTTTTAEPVLIDRRFPTPEEKWGTRQNRYTEFPYAP